MGSGASRESSEEASPQITGTSTSGRSSPGNRTRSLVAKVHEKSADPNKNAPVKRATNEHFDSAIMSDSEIKKNTDILAVESESELIPSAKSSSDFDDEAFEKFCGEIDRVLERDVPVVKATAQRRKSSVSSSVVRDPDTRPLLPELPTCAGGREGEFLDGRRPSGPGQPSGSFQFEQQVNNRCTSDNQLQHQQLAPYHRQHMFSQQQHQQANLQQQQADHQQHAHRPIPTMTAPPPLAVKTLEKPVSLWKRPEDLAHREQLLRDRYQGTWFGSKEKSASRLSGASLVRGASRDEGSMMGMRQNSDLVSFQEERREFKWEDALSQDKEGFDVAKFKAANKKTNSHRVDKLLPATYKGYNASLSRQGTLPSLHRSSISSTPSSSRTPASDTHGSSTFDDSKELKYNPSEEALLDFIEKEFS